MNPSETSSLLLQLTTPRAPHLLLQSPVGDNMSGFYPSALCSCYKGKCHCECQTQVSHRERDGGGYSIWMEEFTCIHLKGHQECKDHKCRSIDIQIKKLGG